MKNFFLAFFFVIPGTALHAQDTITVHFDTYDNINGTSWSSKKLAYMNHDSIFFSGKWHQVIFPAEFNHRDTAFTTCYFTGWNNMPLDRSTGILVGDHTSMRPVLYIDRNHNMDFSDDGSPVIFSADSTLVIYLHNENHPMVMFPVKYYYFSWPDSTKEKNQALFESMGPLAARNQFVPIDYWFAEQRLNSRVTNTVINGENVRIGIKDWNCNGLYNDKGTDLIMAGNYMLNSISAHLQQGALKYTDTSLLVFNGTVYEVLEIGDYMTLVKSNKPFEKPFSAGD